MKARRMFLQTTRRYGYRGKEIAECLRKDPASVAGYLQGEQYDREIYEVLGQLKADRQYVNSKV
jgi:hypothetical protein